MRQRQLFWKIGRHPDPNCQRHRGRRQSRQRRRGRSGQQLRPGGPSTPWPPADPPAGGPGGDVGAPPSFTGFPKGPNRQALQRAFRQTLHRFIANGRARYGCCLYTDLTHTYSFDSMVISGDQATVTINYSGGVRFRVTGKEVDASGTASVDYTWMECRWAELQIND